MNLRYCCLWIAVAFVCGCGREERTEAVRFCKVLMRQRADFASVNAIENDFLAGTRSWCGTITTGGSGRGDQLARLADEARDLAKSATLISAQLGRVRQAVYDEQLNKDYPQSIRGTLTRQLIERQRFLQEMRALLEESAPVFLELRQKRDYTGDTYPGGIGKLNEILQIYKGPVDILAQAITALRTKYSIKDAELGT